MTYLIEQSSNPSGAIGRTMMRIMGAAHDGYMNWGIAQLKPGDTCLDIGCGAGKEIERLCKANLFRHVYAVDYSDDAVRMAARRNEAFIKARKATIAKANVLSLPFEDNFFSAAFTCQSHYHWPDVLHAVIEVHRVVKPGGQFVLVSEKYKIGYHMDNYNTPEGTKQLFADGGFHDIALFERRESVCVVGIK